MWIKGWTSTWQLQWRYVLRYAEASTSWNGLCKPSECLLGRNNCLQKSNVLWKERAGIIRTWKGNRSSDIRFWCQHQRWQYSPMLLSTSLLQGQWLQARYGGWTAGYFAGNGCSCFFSKWTTGIPVSSCGTRLPTKGHPIETMKTNRILYSDGHHISA